MTLETLGPTEWECVLWHLRDDDCSPCLGLSRSIRGTLLHDDVWKGLAQRRFRELGLADPKLWLCDVGRGAWRSPYAPTTYR